MHAHTPTFPPRTPLQTLHAPGKAARPYTHGHMLHAPARRNSISRSRHRNELEHC